MAVARLSFSELQLSREVHGFPRLTFVTFERQLFRVCRRRAFWQREKKIIIDKDFPTMQ